MNLNQYVYIIIIIFNKLKYIFLYTKIINYRDEPQTK